MPFLFCAEVRWGELVGRGDKTRLFSFLLGCCGGHFAANAGLRLPPTRQELPRLRLPGLFAGATEPNDTGPCSVRLPHAVRFLSLSQNTLTRV